jgi:predicted transcriptional regulator
MADHMVKVTFTIDPMTAVSLQELAAEWGVPKSEAIRRAVRQAKERQLLQAKIRTPLEVLEHLDRHPILSAAERKTRLGLARRMRKDWNRRGTN